MARANTYRERWLMKRRLMTVIPARRILRLAPVLVLCAVAGRPAGAQTLVDALATAYTTNPTLRAARADLRVVNEGVPQALSNWRPEVTVSAELGRQRSERDLESSSSTDNTTPNRAELQVRQFLYRGGRTIADVKASEDDVRAQRALLLSTEQGVLLNAATAYWDVWRDQAIVELNFNNERVIARQLEATQDRFTVGEVTRTDVAQAETRLADATAQRVSSEGDLTASRAVFEQIVGGPPTDLEPPFDLGGLPATLDEVVQLAITSNPDVVSAVFAEKAQQSRIRETTGELLPTLQVTGSASRAEDTISEDTLTEQLQVLAELTVPLYQQGSVTSRVREAKQFASRLRIQVEEVRRREEQEAISAWQALETARANILSFESGVRSAEIALEGVQQENLVGARTILDILDAEQELLDAQVSLVGSQRDEIVAGFQVLTAIGRMTAKDLTLPVEVYEPEADYLKVRNRWFGLEAPGTE